MNRILRLALIILTVLLTEPTTRADEHEPLDCFLVVTGGELLEGVYPDGHTCFITRTLRPMGVRCVGSMSVDDNRADIVRALRFATNRARLVIVTGGLGPTPNDITRETLSEFTGVRLVEDEAALAAMERRLSQPRDQLRPNLRRQCLVPEHGGFLKNSNGTAGGLVFEWNDCCLIALPGPPRELQPMVRDELVPLLQQRFGLHVLGATLTLRFVGAGQSQIAQALQEHVPVPEDILVTSLFEGSRVDFTFAARHDTPVDRERLREIERGLRGRLEGYYYADDGSALEQVVLRELAKGGHRLAIAEVATGGALAASLNAFPEARGVLAGALAAPDSEGALGLLPGAGPRWQGAVSAEDRAKLLAETAAAEMKTDWAVVLGEGDLPDGTGAVWLAIKASERWVTQRLTLRSAGAVDRAGLVTPVLDRVRRVLRESGPRP